MRTTPEHDQLITGFLQGTIDRRTFIRRAAATGPLVPVVVSLLVSNRNVRELPPKRREPCPTPLRRVHAGCPLLTISRCSESRPPRRFGWTHQRIPLDFGRFSRLSSRR